MRAAKAKKFGRFFARMMSQVRARSEAHAKPPHCQPMVDIEHRPTQPGYSKPARVEATLSGSREPSELRASTTARPSTSWQVRRTPRECQSRRAGTPRIVRVGPSSGPDGEGQARGQARNVRGEPRVCYHLLVER